MTTQPDIIERVKYLQAKCLRPDGTWLVFPEERGLILDAIPAIADALLIAVKGLEASALRCEKSCRGVDTKSGESLCAGCPARAALSRIRHSPSQQ